MDSEQRVGNTSQWRPQDSMSGWIRYFLSCRDLHPYNMPV
jgi:hypothetical protein